MAHTLLCIIQKLCGHVLDSRSPATVRRYLHDFPSGPLVTAEASQGALHGSFLPKIYHLFDLLFLLHCVKFWIFVGLLITVDQTVWLLEIRDIVSLTLADMSVCDCSWPLDKGVFTYVCSLMELWTRRVFGDDMLQHFSDSFWHIHAFAWSNTVLSTSSSLCLCAWLYVYFVLSKPKRWLHNRCVVRSTFDSEIAVSPSKKLPPHPSSILQCFPSPLCPFCNIQHTLPLFFLAFNELSKNGEIMSEFGFGHRDAFLLFLNLFNSLTEARLKGFSFWGQRGEYTETRTNREATSWPAGRRSRLHFFKMPSK